MQIGQAIKKVREAKGLSQKEVALLLKMDQAQYSRIENGKTDPSFSAVEKIAQALGINLSELMAADEIFKEVQSADKTLIEKVRLIEGLEEKEKNSILTIIDMAIAKKRFKDNLSQLLAS